MDSNRSEHEYNGGERRRVKNGPVYNPNLFWRETTPTPRTERSQNSSHYNNRYKGEREHFFLPDINQNSSRNFPNSHHNSQQQRPSSAKFEFSSRTRSVPQHNYSQNRAPSYGQLNNGGEPMYYRNNPETYRMPERESYRGMSSNNAESYHTPRERTRNNSGSSIENYNRNQAQSRRNAPSTIYTPPPLRNNFREMENYKESNANFHRHEELLENERYEEMYVSNMKNYPYVPSVIHDEVISSSAPLITATFESMTSQVFDSEISDFGVCHLITTVNPTTRQHWVRVFQVRTGLKNPKITNLLNRHLVLSTDIELWSKQGVKLGTSRNFLPTPNDNGALFLFNFFQRSEAMRFLSYIEEGKMSYWKNETIKKTEQFLSTVSSVIEQRPSTSLHLPTISKITSKRPSTAFGLPRVVLQLPPKGKNMSSNNNKEKETVTEFDSEHARLICSGVRLYMTSCQNFESLGEGEIYIVEEHGLNMTGYDKLLFLNRESGEVSCSHLIYPWNLPNEVPSSDPGSWECSWIAAANLATLPTQLPTVQEFKLAARHEEDIRKFILAFRRSANSALEKRLSGAGREEKRNKNINRKFSQS